MKRKIFAAVSAVLAAVCLLIFLRKPNGGEVVKITQDGELLYTLDLNDKENQSREIVVEYEGRRNVISVEHGEVCMKSADCPDKTCVKMGKLSGGAPIVCLPNRLVIEYADSSADGATG